MKKVALLICDDPNPEYMTKYGDYLEMFSRAFPGIQFIGFEIYKGVFPKNILAYSAFFMTGSRYSVYDDFEWIEQGKQLIRQIHQNKLKFIGVCFGHQMMAEALGGKVTQATSGWNVGIKEFTITDHQKWMDSSTASFKVQMMCQDQVIFLPPLAHNLADTFDCAYGMIGIGDHMLSIQGHPEFPVNYTRDLIILRRKKIGERKAQEALTSLNNMDHLNLINQYLLNFLHFSNDV